MRGDVTMRDERTTNDEQLKIELLSQWKLEAEFRNSKCFLSPFFATSIITSKEDFNYGNLTLWK